ERGESDHAGDGDQYRKHAPEGELAPEAAAIDDHVGIERHLSGLRGDSARTVAPCLFGVNGAQEGAAIVANKKQIPACTRKKNRRACARRFLGYPLARNAEILPLIPSSRQRA